MVVSNFFYWFLFLLGSVVLVTMPVLVSIVTLPFVYTLTLLVLGVVSGPLFNVYLSEKQAAVYLLGVALAGLGVLASVGGSFPVALGFVGVSFLCMCALFLNLIGSSNENS